MLTTARPLAISCSGVLHRSGVISLSLLIAAVPWPAGADVLSVEMLAAARPLAVTQLLPRLEVISFSSPKAAVPWLAGADALSVEMLITALPLATTGVWHSLVVIALSSQQQMSGYPMACWGRCSECGHARPLSITGLLHRSAVEPLAISGTVHRLPMISLSLLSVSIPGLAGADALSMEMLSTARPLGETLA